MALPLSYNWKNLFVRKTTTLLTCLVIAVVVGVFSWLVGFWEALDRSLSFADDTRKLIVLKQGATSETNSAIPPADESKLTQIPEIAAGPDGQPLRSPEMIVQVSLPRLRDRGATFANVAVRGVTDTAFKVHRRIRPLGQSFQQGAMEVIVGLQAHKQFAGLDIGNVINLGYGGNRGYRIVGYFSADNGPMESEIWGPFSMLKDSYKRDMYSSVSVRLNDVADTAEVIKRIQGPGIELDAQTEPQYWRDQSKNIRIYMGIVGGLVAIMCLAAVFAIANTMFATTAGRTREFAMLRTIGFTGRQIMASVIIESVLLALLGAVLGCAGCWGYLRLAGNTKDMFGATSFTTLGFEISMTPMTVLAAIVLVSVVSANGAIVPAYRASKLQPVTALREA